MTTSSYYRRALRHWYLNLNWFSLFGAHVKQRKMFLDFKQDYYLNAQTHAASNKAAAARRRRVQQAALQQQQQQQQAQQTAAAADKKKLRSRGGAGNATGAMADDNNDADLDEDSATTANDSHSQQSSSLVAKVLSKDDIRKQIPIRMRKKKSLKDTMEAKSSLEFAVTVGKTASRSEGTNISWRLSKLDKPEVFFVRQKLPIDCTSAVMMELLLRTDADEKLVARTAVTLKMFLTTHFGEELQEHPFFRGIFVFAAQSDADGAKVLRVVVAFKKMSIDAYLEQIFIPFSLAELFTEVKGELSTNVHILDLLSNSSASMDNLLSGKVSAL